MFTRFRPGLAAAAFCLLLPTAAQSQVISPLDQYRDAYGSPNYTGNLTPAPDDRSILGSGIAAGDPWSERQGTVRGWRELDDPNQGYWEYRADRLRQLRQSEAMNDRLRRDGLSR
ncbi:hypothetical protein [Azospirillum sp. SYSU D00513]|uniref:hypothetical protein n=1 Tax=Azospirillum sp. SYSU D00513 TaxID=2812561 RepID=UPI001A962AE5|nr:hypothetical protein [Azospirillum sp. SYSU D00513]